MTNEILDDSKEFKSNNIFQQATKSLTLKLVLIFFLAYAHTRLLEYHQGLMIGFLQTWMLVLLSYFIFAFLIILALYLVSTLIPVLPKRLPLMKRFRASEPITSHLFLNTMITFGLGLFLVLYFLLKYS